jgi:hypothetical protein
MKKLYALIAALGLASFSLGAVTIESLSLHLFIKGLSHPVPPKIEDGWLVLTVGGVHRFVGAAFEHEGFAKIHPFERNERGVFVLAYQIPLEFESPLAYRLVVDGAWIADPWNSSTATLADSGLAVSLVEVPRISSERPGVYRVLGKDGRTAHFLFKGAPGEIVSVAGSFNNWDPFTHLLEETSPGVYELILPLPPGLNLYTYVYRGESIPDPLNVEKASDRYDRVVSVLRVGFGPVPGDPVIRPMDLRTSKKSGE